MCTTPRIIRQLEKLILRSKWQIDLRMRFNDSLWMVWNQKPILPFFGGIQYLNTSELLPPNTNQECLKILLHKIDLFLTGSFWSCGPRNVSSLVTKIDDGKKGNAKSVKTKSLGLFKKDVGYFFSVFWYPLTPYWQFLPYLSISIFWSIFDHSWVPSSFTCLT